MPTALALDQATTTGWTFGSTRLELGEWQSGHFRAPKRPLVGQRLVIIEDCTLELIERFNPEVLVYEEPFDPTVTYQQRGKVDRQFSRKTMNFLQKVAGAVEMAAARKGIPIERYATNSWRSALKLPRKPAPQLQEDGTLKEAPADWIKKQTRDAIRHMGANVETLDESDSWGLCFYALHGQAGIKRATDNLFARAEALIRD